MCAYSQAGLVLCISIFKCVIKYIFKYREKKFLFQYGTITPMNTTTQEVRAQELQQHLKDEKFISGK